ncbi:hypothetical protein FO440_23475 [Mucilaginibacter corticis]|uniref:Uncharacterized protein n=1 Tax=Mucilaginibacter corticis TaxID=2597670 RepID=A0A556M7S7_9SPHI|nr:hypothetical protein [Mucilaginibacter corticis]TSJ35885.1 hypothetical protein FO440_23475 [Mucilaginibacter corticis]
MKNLTNDSKKSLIKLLVSGGINCITNEGFRKFLDAHAVTIAGVGASATGLGIVAPIVAGVANSISSNIASNHVNKLANVDDLLSWIENSDPGSINHDLEKSIIRAGINAFKFIEVLYIKGIKQDETFWLSSEPDEKKEFLSKLKKFFRQANEDLKREITYIKIQRKFIQKPQPLLKALSDYILIGPNGNLSPADLKKFKDFYIYKMPYCFDLAFKEELKSNDRSYKAFQMWIAEGIQKQNIHILHLQEKALKVEIPKGLTMQYLRL